MARESVTLPILRWQSDKVDGPAAALFGASYFVVLRKSADGIEDGPVQPDS